MALAGTGVAVDGAVNGAHDLTVTGGGEARFGGAIGNVTRLGAIAIDSDVATTLAGAVRAASLVTGAGGTLAIDGGSVDTTGGQRYGQRAVLGGATTLAGTTVSLTHGAEGPALTVQADTLLAGSVSTTGAQRYTQAMTLAGNASLEGDGVRIEGAVDGSFDLAVDAGSGDARFDGAIGSQARIGALTLQSGGATTLGGTVRATSLTSDAAGTLSIGGGSVHTTGAQTWGERAVLDGATTLTGSSVTLQQGAQGTALTVAGATTLGGNVTTSGAQHYAGTLALGSDVALTGAGVAVDGAADGAHDLTVNAGSGDASFGSTVGATTRLGALTIHTSGATTLAGAVRAASVATDAAGTLALGGGSVDTTGTQTWGERAGLTGATTLTGSSITLQQGAQGTALTVDGAAVLGNGVLTSGAQHYTGTLALAADVALTGEGVAIDGAIDGARSLMIVAGSSAARLGGPVGATTRLGALSVQTSGATTLAGAVRATTVVTDAPGTLAIDGGSVDTTSIQLYGERAVLGGATTLAGAQVTLQQGAQGTALAVSGATVLGGGVTTSGAQAYGGRLDVGTDLELTGSAITVDGSLNGAHSMEVRATAGDVQFRGAIGDGTRVGSMLVTGDGAITFGAAVRAASLTVGGAGTLALDGGSVDTTGVQYYDQRVDLGAATTLTGTTVALRRGAQGPALTVNGSAILVGDVLTAGAQHYAGALTVAEDVALAAQGVRIDGALEGAHDLAIDAGAGDLHIGGTVGAGTRLGSLSLAGSGATTLAGAVRAASVTTDAAGTLAIGGGSVDTTGAQTWGERAVLDAVTTLTGSSVSLQQGAQGTALTVAGAAVLGGGVQTTGAQHYAGTLALGGDIALTGAGVAVDGAVDGAHDLAVNAGNGDARFGGTIGATTRLGALTIQTSGATTLAGAVRAASVATDGAGTLALGGGSVDTTGTQTWGERAVLEGATTLAGSTVTLQQGAQGTALAVSGAAVLGGGVTTSGAQHYAGTLALGADVALSGTGVAVDGAVDGAHALAVNAGSGDARFGSTIGATTRLGALAIDTSGATTLAGAVRAASVATDSAGTLAVNGGSVDTTGTQTYGERAMLGSATTLTGSTVTLQQGAEGPALTVQGAARLAGAVTTEGAQRYAGALTLAGDVALEGQGVRIDGAVDGGHDLAVEAGAGAAQFGGALGAGTRLGALAVQSSGATTLAGAVRAASVTTDAAGTLALDGGSVDTTGAQTYGERALLGSATTLTASQVTLQQGAQGPALTIAGATTLGGGVATGGAQHYGGALLLAADVQLEGSGVAIDGQVDGAHALTVEAGSGDAQLGGALGSTTRLGALTVHASGATTLAGAVRAASVTTDAAGTLTIGGGSIDTTGAQAYGERAVLDGATTLAGSSVTLQQGAQGTALTVAGATVLGSGVQTTGAQHYAGTLALGGDVALTGAGVEVDGAVDGAHHLAVNAGAGDARFGGTVGATTRLGALTIQTSGITTLAGAVRAASVATDGAGTLALGGGSVDTTGTQTWGERAVLEGATTLAGSTVTLQQGAQGTALAVSGAAVLGGGVTTSGAQHFAGPLALGADVALSGTGVAVDGAVDGAHALAVNAGSGDARFGSTIGATTRLGALAIDTSGATTLAGAVRAASVATDAAGTLALDGGSVHTTGAQTWGERAVLGTATTLTGSQVTLQQGAQGPSLTIAGASTLGGGVATTGAQHYGGVLVLAADVQLEGSGVAIDGQVDGAHALTVEAGSGGAQFGGALGSATRLGALTVHASGATTLAGAVRAASVTTDAAGSLTIGGGSVDTTGEQIYGERAVLDGATTLAGSSITLQQGAQGTALTITGATVLGGGVQTTGAQHYAGTLALGGDIALTGTGVAVDGAVEGAHDLAVNAGSAGARFGGTIGATTRLGALTIQARGATTLAGAVRAGSVNTDAAGTLTIAGGGVDTTGTQNWGERAVLEGATTLAGSSITLQQGAKGTALTVAGATVLGGDVTTSGAQHYAGTLALGADVALAGGGVAVDGAVDGAQDLAVDAGNGSARFGGTIGATMRLGALTIQTSGATTLAGAVRAASVATDGAGTLALGGGSVDTTGTQTWGERAVLEGATTLAGSTVTLQQGAQGTALAVSGAAVLGGGVTTSGAQHYAGTLALGADVALSGTGVAVDGAVDGAHALAVNAGSGDARFGSTIGATTRLGALAIDTSGATTLAGAVRAASVATDSAGTLAVNGGSVDTTGTQTYGERAMLGSATTLTGSTVTLQQGAEGPALTIAGAAVLGGGVTTTGAQRYAGTLDLAADVALRGEGVALDGALNGAHDLAVDAGSGDLRLGGPVGASTRLGALTLQTSGAATLAGAVRAASVDTGAEGTLALAGGLVDTTGTQAYGQRVLLGADTTLRGTRISLLAGADAQAADAQALAIEGDAVLGGPLGAGQALGRLDVGGATTLAAGTVTTTGDQTFGGALQVVGDQQLHSLSGTLTLAGTVDSGGAQPLAAGVDTGGRANLTLVSDGGAVAVQGAVGADSALGALTVRAASTLDFGGQVRAYRLHQTVGGASHYLGTVWVDGADGIDLRGASVRFEQAVTATTGALNVALTDAAGSLAFAAGANVATATGFAQSGGAAVLLPSSVVVTKGPITLAAPAYLPAGAARIETEGDITIAGLSGPSTELTLAAGHGSRGSPGAGRLLVGLDDGNPLHVLDVARLTVPDAGSAELFGRIAGRGGALTASLVGGGLVKAPYFANGTPWGPMEVINRLTATTVPPNVVPSTAARQSLFLRQPGPADITAKAHGDHAEPPVVQPEGEGVNTTGDQ